MQEAVKIKDLSKVEQRGVRTVMALWFLMNGGFFLLIPLLSIHYVDELGWAAAFIGAVLAVRQFTQQGLTVFGGALADRFGAKGLIMLGVLIRSFSFVMMGYASTRPTLFLAGLLAAFGGALFDSPSKAALAALAPESSLPNIYAQVGILQNLARTIGPVLGALLISLDFKIVGIAAAMFFLLAFFVILFGLPNVQVSTDKQSVTKGLGMAFNDRAFITYTALMMGFWFMWVQISIALPLKAKVLSDSNAGVGVLLMVNAVFAIILQVPALRLAQRYLHPLPMLILGIALMALGLGSVALVITIFHLYLSIFFFALGSVLVVPNAQTVVATMANPRARGAYFGVNSLALACGGGIGQIVGGSMVDIAARWQIPALPWIVSATVGTAAALGLLHFYKQQRRQTASPTLRPLGGD
jgi:DHA1 family multidrug resistance protein-like MFS transporter